MISQTSSVRAYNKSCCRTLLARVYYVIASIGSSYGQPNHRKRLRPEDQHMTSKGCKQHAKGQWCIWGCSWNIRVCHMFARGQQCPPGCRYVHLSHQKTGDEQYDNPNHEQTPEPKAMPKPKARHTTPQSHKCPTSRARQQPRDELFQPKQQKLCVSLVSIQQVASLEDRSQHTTIREH